MEIIDQSNLEQTPTIEKLQVVIKELNKVLEHKQEETNRLRITLGAISFIIIACLVNSYMEEKTSTRANSIQNLSK